MIDITVTSAIKMVEKIDFNQVRFSCKYIIEMIEINLFNDIFALKWLISIISMHGVIEKIELNGAQL